MDDHPEVPSKDRWIFLTGMIRSGTTFVGNVLTLPWSVGYLHEPFNGGVRAGDGTPFSPQYIAPDAPDAQKAAYRTHVQPIFDLELTLPVTNHPNDSRFRKIVKSLVGSRGPVNLTLARFNPVRRVMVLKDPVAKLSTEFLYREFSVQPVVMVRHPVSLAASLDRVSWYPEMKDFLEQPELLRNYFADEEEFLNRQWSSRLLEAMAHWRATYKVLLQQAGRYPSWHMVTHEDLSANPVHAFKQLYHELALPWTSRVERNIRQMTGTKNTTEASGNQAMDLNRDSHQLFEMRRDSIPVELRREIFDIVEDVALQLYSRESFAID